MKCQQAEKSIISLNELNEKEGRELNNHLSQCPKCVNFKKKYEILHKKIEKEKFLTPSEILQQQTRMLCLQEMSGQSSAAVPTNGEKLPVEIPLFARITLTILIALLLSWGVPVLRNYIEKDILTGETIYLFIILAQNILALMFAPILLRFFKLKRQALNYT
jgi:hypothetical protein